jgi:hypothetical protein
MPCYLYVTSLARYCMLIDKLKAGRVRSIYMCFGLWIFRICTSNLIINWFLLLHSSALHAGFYPYYFCARNIIWFDFIGGASLPYSTLFIIFYIWWVIYAIHVSSAMYNQSALSMRIYLFSDAPAALYFHNKHTLICCCIAQISLFTPSFVPKKKRNIDHRLL